jgi:hypothetical protein
MTQPPDNVFLLRRAPRLDGPYDDERNERSRRFVDGNLALAFPPSSAQAYPLQLVPPAGGVDDDPDDAHRTTAPITDPRRLVGPLAQAVAEVLMGARPPQQLSDVATLQVLGLLERNAGRLAPRTPGRLAPRPSRVPPRPRVTSLRLCEPLPGIAEVAAVIDTGGRRRAMAMRLEAFQGRWRCTVLRVG